MNGLSAILKSHYRWMIYVHCAAHRVNLMVNSLIKASRISIDVISTVNKLYTHTNKPKVRLIWENTYKELYPNLQVKYVPQQINIRWGCKFDAVHFLYKQPQVFATTLIRVSEDENMDESVTEEATGCIIRQEGASL